MPLLPLPPAEWPKLDVGEFGPRPVRILEDALLQLKTLRGISITIVVLGLMAVFYYSFQVNRFVTRGEVVMATVDELRERSEKGTPQPSIGYRYTFEGYRYYGREYLSAEELKTLKVGATVPVTVLKDSPNDHRYGRVTERDAQEARSLGSLLVFVHASLVGFFAFRLRWQMRRQKEILSSWRALPGQVTQIQTVRQGNQDFAVVTYRVRCPDGTLVTREHRRLMLSAVFWPVPAAVGNIYPVFVPPEGPLDPRQFQPRWTLTTVEIDPGGTAVS